MLSDNILSESFFPQKSIESSVSVTTTPSTGPATSSKTVSTTGPSATYTVSHILESILSSDFTEPNDIDNETAQNGEGTSRSDNDTSANIGNETSGRKQDDDDNAECYSSDYNEVYGDWINWLFCDSYIYPITNATLESEEEVDDDITDLESDPRGRWEEVTRTFKTRFRNESEYVCVTK